MTRDPFRGGDRVHRDADSVDVAQRDELPPGKRTLTQHLRGPDAGASRSAPTFVQRATRAAYAVTDEVIEGGLADAFASSGGDRLPEPVRTAAAQIGLGDVGDARIHTDAEAAAASDALGARAFTVGRDIHFAAGQYQPGTPSGDALLGHELAHTVQQAGASGIAQPKLHVSQPGDALETEADAVGPAMADAMAGRPTAQVQVSRGSAAPGTVARERADVPPAAAAPSSPPPGAGELLEIPPDLLSEPGPADVLVAVAGGRMAALPAPHAVYLVSATPAPADRAPAARPAFTLPTIGKEGLIGVRVGAQLGFLIDAGGRPAVVAPHALAEIRSALGVSTLQGVLIAHIHDDHVQSLVAIVESSRIRAENLHVPEAFGTNPAAPSSTLARLQRELGQRESLRALGYGPDAHVGTIATAAEGSTFHQQIRRGGVAIDYYGLTDAFERLATNRRQGRPQPEADTASLLVRVTHEESGMRWLYVSDLRGRDLAQFRTQLGEARYNELLSGVSAIVGFQHHLGATRPADMNGLIDLLQRVQLQGGRLRVLAQSQEELSGRQFLNRPLIRALTEMGIDVEVASQPAAGGVGSVTVDTAGDATSRGGGTQSFAGSPEARAQFERLERLRETERILTQYGRHLRSPIVDATAIRAAREALEAQLREYIEGTMRNIEHGEAARRRNELRDPAAQDRARQTIGVRQLIEDELTPARMEQVRELGRLGPHLDTFERARAEARTTGRMPDYGIEALWELSPETAARLLRDSGLPRRMTRNVATQLPGQPAAGGPRLVAAGLIVIEAANIAGPIIAQERQLAFDRDVREFLEVILWWQAKGVIPRMQGVDDGLLGNTTSTDAATLSQMLAERDLDYLAMPGLPEGEAAWERFRIWASLNLRSYRDFIHHLMNEGVQRDALRKRGGTHLVEAEWEYRASRIATPWYGHDVQVEWKTNPHLTKTLRACARAAVDEAIAGVTRRADQAGSEMESRVVAPDRYVNRGTFGGLPAATGSWRFRRDIAEPSLFTLRDHERIAARHWYLLYSFPAQVAAGQGAVPEGHLVVGGADIVSYEAIVTGPNIVNMPRQTPTGTQDSSQFVPHNGTELLLARQADLVPA